MWWLVCRSFISGCQRSEAFVQGPFIMLVGRMLSPTRPPTLLSFLLPVIRGPLLRCMQLVVSSRQHPTVVNTDRLAVRPGWLSGQTHAVLVTSTPPPAVVFHLMF